jgi:hypothetical protein
MASNVNVMNASRESRHISKPYRFLHDLGSRSGFVISHYVFHLAAQVDDMILHSRASTHSIHAPAITHEKFPIKNEISDFKFTINFDYVWDNVWWADVEYIEY